VKNKTSPLKWVFNSSKRHLFSIIMLVIIGVLLSLCWVGLALISRNVIDIAAKQIVGNLLNQFLLLALIILVQMVLQVFFASLNIRTSGKLSISFKKQLFSTLLKKDWTSVSNFHSGELLNTITSDTSVITSAIVSIVPNLVSFLTRIVVSFGVLFMMDPVFASIFLVVGPMIMVVSRVYSKKMKDLHKKCQESDGKARSFMQETLQNLLVIKSFGNENAIITNSTKLQNNNFILSVKRNNISIIANICFYIAITVGYYFALAWGAYKISQGIMTYGTLIAMLQLVGQVQGPFRDLSGLLPQYYSMLASAERIMELENLADEVEFNDKTIDCNKIYADLSEILINNVTFTYDKENILENATLGIKKGDFIAIEGTSGIGKSTLLKLILGIIMPKYGTISFNMKDNSKIKMDKHTRSMFSYVPQGNMILSGTIRDNILFSKLDINDVEVIKAAQIAEIWGFIDSLPQNLDTELGEKGIGLSEGQIQRIAIARAVLHNSPILLLDEATSALDEKTEWAVLNNLKSLNTKTCIVISHKKAALDVCNKSICIRNGQIIQLEDVNA